MGFFSGYRIAILGIRDPDFYFELDRDIKKEILKPRKIPEKMPSEKSRKSQNPGDRDRDKLPL